MIEWKTFPENKPEKATLAVVGNTKGVMMHTFAVYHPQSDCWVLDDPLFRKLTTVSVTHYIEIPALPLRYNQ